MLLYLNNLQTSIGVDLDDQLLLRHIFGPSEYRSFFSISTVFKVLMLPALFLNAYKYSIQILNSVTLKKNIILKCFK